MADLKGQEWTAAAAAASFSARGKGQRRRGGGRWRQGWSLMQRLVFEFLEALNVFQITKSPLKYEMYVGKFMTRTKRRRRRKFYWELSPRGTG